MRLAQIIKYFIIWQIVILAIAALAGRFLPVRTENLGGGVAEYLDNPTLHWRTNFDGNNFIKIATDGHTDTNRELFPLYPRLIDLIWTNGEMAIIVGIIVSGVACLLSLVYLAKLIEIDYSSNIARWTILALLAFPASFFFTIVYSESLLFLLIISAFYYGRKGSWAIAGVLGGLASNTGIMGILLLPVLAVEVVQQKRYRSLLWLALIPFGLWLHVSKITDPFSLLHLDKITMLYQVFWRYLRVVYSLGAQLLLPYNASILLELLTGLLFLVLSVCAFIKLRFSYALFICIAYFLPTLNGNFVSYPRFMLLAFPGFMIIGTILSKHATMQKMYLITSTVLLVIYCALFVRGYWVA